MNIYTARGPFVLQTGNTAVPSWLYTGDHSIATLRISKYTQFTGVLQRRRSNVIYRGHYNGMAAQYVKLAASNDRRFRDLQLCCSFKESGVSGQLYKPIPPSTNNITRVTLFFLLIHNRCLRRGKSHLKCRNNNGRNSCAYRGIKRN